MTTEAIAGALGRVDQVVAATVADAQRGQAGPALCSPRTSHDFIIAIECSIDTSLSDLEDFGQTIAAHPW